MYQRCASKRDEHLFYSLEFHIFHHFFFQKRRGKKYYLPCLFFLKHYFFPLFSEIQSFFFNTIFFLKYNIFQLLFFFIYYRFYLGILWSYCYYCLGCKDSGGPVVLSSRSARIVVGQTPNDQYAKTVFHLQQERRPRRENPKRENYNTRRKTKL